MKIKKIIMMALITLLLSGCAYSNSHDLITKQNETYKEDYLIKTIEHKNGTVTRIYGSDICY